MYSFRLLLITRLPIVALLVAAVLIGATGTVRSPNGQTNAVALTAETGAATLNTSPSAMGIADSSLYFMNATDLAAAMQAFQAMGVTQIRVFLPWRAMEPSKGNYNWVDADRILNAAAAQGMAVVGAVTSSPIWSSRNGFWMPNAPPIDPANYATFMAQLAQRYGAGSAQPRIAAYEIWNEPNGNVGWSPQPDAAGYTALLKAAYSAIKQVEPGATVVGGVLGAGLTFGTWTVNPVNYLTQMYAAGAQGYFDALSFHPYNFSSSFSAGAPYANTPYQQLMSLRTLMNNAGDSGKLIWTTEYGVPTSAVNAATQAAWIADFATTWSGLSGVGPMFIYSLVDRPNDTPWGVFTQSWAAKPAAQVIKNWIGAHPTDPTASAAISKASG